MKSRLWVIIVLILIILSTTISYAKNDVVYFSYFEMPPYAHKNKDGKPEGLVIDLMNYIARKEGWNIQYIHTNYNSSLLSIKKGQYDISFSEKNDKSTDVYFSNAPIYSEWGKVYVNKNTEIYKLSDLEGKIIATLRNQHAEELKKILKKQHINAEFLYVSNYLNVFKQIGTNTADAGVVSKGYGLMYQEKYKFKDTDISLYPIDLYYISNLKLDSKYIKTLEKYLIQLKEDEDSYYYWLLDKWMSSQYKDNKGIPRELIPAMSTIGFVCFLFTMIICLIVLDIMENRKALEKSLKERVIAEERFKLAVEGSNEGIWEWNKEDNILYGSARWKSMIGYDEDTPISLYFIYKRLHPNDRIIVHEKFKNIFEGKTDYFTANIRLKCKDGKYKWILSRGKALRDDTDKVLRVAGSHSDIDEVVHLTKEIEYEREFVSNIFETSQNIIFVLNKDGSVTSISNYTKKLLGYDEHELGTDILNTIFPEYEHNVMSQYLEDINKYPQGVISDIITKSDDVRSILWNLSYVSDPHGIREILFIGMDITESEKTKRIVQRLAYYDQLSGLPNRQSFMIELNKTIESKTIFALMYIDLDNFKNINDVYGHNFGDKFLVTIANIIKSCVESQGGFAARLSGDEFAVIIKESNTQGINIIAEMIKSHLNNQIIVEDILLDTTASMGIAFYPKDGTTDQDLLICADSAMYKAKSIGKNTFQYFNQEIYKELIDKNKLISQLKKALLNEEFILYYQPVYNTTKEEISVVETLVRWKKYDEIIPPDKFIHIAEETGLIIPLGEWILKKAFQQSAQWHQKGIKSLLSINISWVQLKQKTFYESVKEFLTEFDIDPSWIIFEITEEIMFNMSFEVLKTVKKIASLGIKIALDDFGTEYSALRVLRSIPIDYLKLDKSNLKGIGDIQNDEELLRGLITLGHKLQVEIIAEGVERADQFTFLEQEGCYNIQGYMISSPKTSEEIEKFIQEYSNNSILTKAHFCS